MKILHDFKDLKKLPEIHMHPVRPKVHCPIDNEDFKSSLSQVLNTDLPEERREWIDEMCNRGPFDIPRFSMDELRFALRRMRRGRCSDSAGVTLEMFLYCGDGLLQAMLGCLNSMLHTGVLPSDWQETLFVMLPKGGSKRDVKNWRPIAILRIPYKIFARLLFQRLQPKLEKSQCSDQCGFRPGKSVDDAFIVLEELCCKSCEWGQSLWVVSLDLTKAFDRIEHPLLFNALDEQGVPAEYARLLSDIYHNQRGSVNGSGLFEITRGVKQGDVLSSLLFNCGLEHAVRRFQDRVCGSGIGAGGPTRLTNIRYAGEWPL